MFLGRWEKLGLKPAWLLALLVPLGAAALLMPLRSHTQPSNLALVMVLVVAATVVPGYKLAALAAGVSAGIWFDFFLTRPYESFTIHTSSDVQTTVLMAVVAVAVGTIAARRRQAREAARRSGDEVIGLYVSAQMLSAGTRAATMVDAIAGQLRDVLFLTGCHFDAERPSLTEPLIDRGGELDWAGHNWSLNLHGWPAAPVSLPVYSNGHEIGRFVLERPEGSADLTQDRLLTAVALSDLAGAALGPEPRERPAAAPAPI